jgi:MFS family permease
MSSSSPVNSADAATTPPMLATAPPAPKPSDWSPLRNPVFRAMWIASAVSYIGYEIRNYAAPLLMIDFKSKFGISDGMAAYTFTASTLPIPLLVLLAGALADVLDRRKLLIFTHLWMMIAAGLLGVLTISHLMTPWLMLSFLFVIGAGFAMANPAFLAVLPELVEPSELRSAMALNSVNMNVARVLGPAIGGLIVGLVGKKYFYAGKGAAFLGTAISVVGVVWVLLQWKPAERKKPAHPETIWGAIRTGLRYTQFSPRLIVILTRVFLFIFCAGILPTFSGIICKKNPTLLKGDTGAAILMASLGVGAIAGVYFMQALQRRFGAEKIVTVCILTFGLAELGVAWTPSLYLGCLAMFVAGFNWVIVPTNFNIATQLAVPAWVKGRAMGMYVLVLWGSMSAGSAFFGRLMTGFADPRLPADHAARAALAYAGLGVLLGSLAILWLRLVPKTVEDFAPAKRATLTDASEQPAFGNSPVWVAVDYRVDSSRTETFHQLMQDLRRQRLRNGATTWHLHDGNGSGIFTESYSFPTWGARLRHHERSTKTDAALEQQIHALHIDPSPPSLRHSTTPPEGLSAPSRPWLDQVAAGISREAMCFFDRMDRARERDAYRFRPRPAVKINLLANKTNT